MCEYHTSVLEIHTYRQVQTHKEVNKAVVRVMHGHLRCESFSQRENCNHMLIGVSDVNTGIRVQT